MADLPTDANVLIGAQNFVDGAAVSAPAGGWSTQLPIANIQTQQIKRIARSASLDPSLTNFTIDFGISTTVGLVAILGHNLTSSAIWRFIASDQPTFNPVKYDSGELLVWPQVEQFGVLPWGSFLWGGVLSTSLVEGYTISSFAPLFGNSFVARYLRIYLLNPSNDAGYLQLGRVYAGPAYQPSLNMQYGMQLGFEDVSNVSYSLGGQRYVDQRDRRRVAKFTVAAVPEEEMLGQIFDQIDRKRGIGGDLVLVLQPKKPREMIRQSFYGALRQLNPMTWSQVPGDRVDRDFLIEELI